MILYEDDDIIVCHKPAGVPVQSASVRTKDMVSILRTHLQESVGQDDRGQARSNQRSDKSVGKNTGMKNAEIKTVGAKSAHEEPRDVYVVHRLDQPVEGVMVFAKTKRAAADLSRQAAGDGMKKRYYAVVELTEAAELNQWHTLVDYLVKDGGNNRSFVSGAGKKDAKRAELRYRILKMEEKTALALAEIELKTGRHHQIRVQMAHAGMPLYGDRKYNPGNMGSAAPSGNFDTKEANHTRRDAVKEGPFAQSLALCAVSLTFRHPRTQKEMTFSVEPEAAIFHDIGNFVPYIIKPSGGCARCT
ncbi:MAG: RluA family pseudouridine synthase [Clostridiales bacterium]|nr:RluA family pseudouridine synthase [Clostridiales bacterium]